MNCEICDIKLSGLMQYSHLRHCMKINYKCICGEVVKITDKKTHEEEYHNLKKCDKCSEVFLNSHTCIYRITNCIYCMEEMEWVDIQDHEYLCGCQTVHCCVCKINIIRKKLKNHISTEHEYENVNQVLRESYRIV